MYVFKCSVYRIWFVDLQPSVVCSVVYSVTIEYTDKCGAYYFHFKDDLPFNDMYYHI